MSVDAAQGTSAELIKALKGRDKNASVANVALVIFNLVSVEQSAQFLLRGDLTMMCCLIWDIALAP